MRAERQGIHALAASDIRGKLFDGKTGDPRASRCYDHADRKSAIDIAESALRRAFIASNHGKGGGADTQSRTSASATARSDQRPIVTSRKVRVGQADAFSRAGLENAKPRPSFHKTPERHPAQGQRVRSPGAVLFQNGDISHLTLSGTRKESAESPPADQLRFSFRPVRQPLDVAGPVSCSRTAGCPMSPAHVHSRNSFDASRGQIGVRPAEILL